VLAGGQSLIPMLALRLTGFDHLVDIGRIAELTGIERRDGQIWIGAGTRYATVEASPDAAAGVPLLTRGHPSDRPLPDPEPGHGGRLARPRRPGG
jgi:carbon-monoxide dehydrogenase medium subunit